jgi:hypothetical protein
MVEPDLGEVSGPLSERGFHNFAFDVSEPEVAALEAICQPLVIDAEAMQDGRLQIMDVYRILDDVVGVIVGFPDETPGFMPRPAIQTVKQRP